MRNYGEDTATIWGGNEDCKHDFNILPSKKPKDKTGENNIAVGADAGRFPLPSKICSKCGAWFGQLGLEEKHELYIEHLRLVFAEVKRVLKKTGTCWVNIGDSYNSNSGFSRATNDWQREGREGGSADKKEYVNLPAKCMCMIPERFAFMMLDLGYILRNKIIWHKPNAMPSSVKDRFNTTWEYLYFFTKNNKPVYWYNDKTAIMVERNPTSQVEGVDWDWKEINEINPDEEDANTGYFNKEQYKENNPHRLRLHGTNLKKVTHWHSVDYWFDLDAVREEHKGTGGGAGFGANALQQSRNKEAREHPSGKNPGDVFRVKTVDESFKRGGMRQAPEPNEEHAFHPLGKNPGDFLNINTQPFPEAHFAVFPEKICEKPILAGCPAEVCKHCGMARVRITKGFDFGRDETKSSYTMDYTAGSLATKRQAYRKLGFETPPAPETIGWTDCPCLKENKYKPGVIIDPFGGSGTVGVVAEKLGRSSILIDIKRDYCEMMIKRLKPLAEQTTLSGKQSKIIRIGF